MTGIETARPEYRRHPSNGLERPIETLPPAPGDRSVRVLWQHAYANGWEQGREQALTAVETTEPRRNFTEAALGLSTVDPQLAQDSYRRFVEVVGRAPLADFDRFVEEHAFWTGHKDAFDAILNERTLLGSTASERARGPRLRSQIARHVRLSIVTTLHRRELYPGLVLAALLGTLAILMARGEELLFGAAILEPLVLALLFGVAARALAAAIKSRRHVDPTVYAAGTGFAAKPVLELAVGLLGASVDLRQMIAAGPALLALIVAGVAFALIVSYSVGRLIGLGPRLATLVAVGNSICGNSAIAAVAPVIRADKREVASAIGLTAVIGIGMVLSLPVLVPLLGLNHYEYGVLAGMSVYAVPQVIAAAFPVSMLSGEVAVFVKLGRVALLGPVVVVIGMLHRLTRSNPNLDAGTRSSWHSYVPWFVLMFFGLGALRSLDLLPTVLVQPTRWLSYGLTILAMAGLGFGVDITAVRSVGPRIAAVIAFSLLFMMGMTLFLLRTLNVTGAEPAQTIYLAPHCVPGQRPEFVLGFRALKTQLGAVMGAPLECVSTTPQGDTVQRTTRGQAYYRLATNTVGFTDGWERYALSTDAGLLYWTGPQPDPPPNAQHIPRF